MEAKGVSRSAIHAELSPSPSVIEKSAAKGKLLQGGLRGQLLPNAGDAHVMFWCKIGEGGGEVTPDATEIERVER